MFSFQKVSFSLDLTKPPLTSSPIGISSDSNSVSVESKFDCFGFANEESESSYNTDKAIIEVSDDEDGNIFVGLQGGRPRRTEVLRIILYVFKC